MKTGLWSKRMTERETTSNDANEDVYTDVAAAGEDASTGEVPDHVELTALLEDARGKADEHWDQVVRLQAEMDNLRKRSRRELADSRRLAQADVLRPILGVMDNFERALQSLHENKDNADLEKFLEGVDLIFQNFQGVLKELGVVPLEAMGVEFDPNFHEAVGRPPRDGVEADQVIEVVQQGFMFGQQVLRPAKVIISA